MVIPGEKKQTKKNYPTIQVFFFFLGCYFSHQSRGWKLNIESEWPKYPYTLLMIFRQLEKIYIQVGVMCITVTGFKFLEKQKLSSYFLRSCVSRPMMLQETPGTGSTSSLSSSSAPSSCSTWFWVSYQGKSFHDVDTQTPVPL